MLLIGTLLALALAAVGYASWWLLRMRRMPLGNWIGVVALALWLAGVSIAWLADREPRQPSRLDSIESLAWPATTEPTRDDTSAAQQGAGVQAAPVESLVSGLEARLAAQPNDAEGWSLLAQSYAYTSNEEAVERAIRRAVELGVDESTLRDRVARAGHRAQPVDWVEHAINKGRYK
jgi:cytochrome c-type biogenesis protein CcmH